MRVPFRVRLALITMMVAASRVSHAAAVDPEQLPPAASRTVDFVKDVQPIFAANCYGCHGPDKQKNDLRLDVKAIALRGGVTGPVIVPGKSAESLLVQYVSGFPEDKRMPAKGDHLSAAQIGVLRAWIDQGPNWPDGLEAKDYVERHEHWAFKPVLRPAVPAADSGSWTRNEVDRFVLARLQKEGLKGSAEADRRTLIRRLYFTLVGLPPGEAEVTAFLNDRSDSAWETLVNRLLDSPQYGERWARHWLDVVRFAESNGFETNTERSRAWPYRDYVIRAFNEDKPYDQFVLEQLAGDAFGVDEATGFLVGGPFDAVKSPDINLTLQQRMDELHDMISTTSTAFLGLTVGCARCHNHKFDPIPQKDYYAMQAVFAGVQHGERPLRTPEYAERMKVAEEKRRELAALEKELESYVPLARTNARPLAKAPSAKINVEEFLTVVAKAVRFTVLETAGRTEPCIDELEVFGADPNENVALARGGTRASASGTYANSDFHKLEHINDGGTGNSRSWISNEPGKGWVQLDFPAPVSINRIVWGRDREEVYKDRLATAYTIEVETAAGEWRQVAERPALRSSVSPLRNVERFPAREARFLRFTILQSAGEPCIDELEVFSAGPDGKNVALAREGTKATASGTYPNSELHKLEHINDGRFGNSRSWISNEPGQGWVQLEFPEVQTINRVIWARDREGKFNDRLATKYKIETALSSNDWTLVASSDDRESYSPDAKPKLAWSAAGLDAGDTARLNKLVREKTRLENELKALTANEMVYAGRFEQPGPTYRLNRGEPLQKREQVNAGVVEGIGRPVDLPADAPEQQRRLALARWIVDPQNPLTARVMVNRIWQHDFGEGIVSTPSDFGHMGAKPVNPELLDWLAAELMEHGWSVKHIQRLILLSATFRQSSQANSQGLKIDAGTRLHWRFPPHRLEAEPLRDTILAVSGRIDLRMGGPGFDLFEPNGNYVKVYNPKKEFGPAEFRRMIYQAKPRMRLDDTFGAFDCPDAGQVAPKRNVSTTPLQALGLLNSPFLLQQAKFFAERVEREAGADIQAQAVRAFRLAFNRPPSEVEAAAAVKVVREEGLKILCRALYNANEFLYVF